LDLASREQKRTKKTAITLLQVKTNLTISANLTKTILFNRKIFLKNSPKNRMHFDKTSTKNATRNSKKFSATKKPAQFCGKTAQLATLPTTLSITATRLVAVFIT